MILNLGVDFGTSSTKVFCRNLSARRDQQLSVIWFGEGANKVSVPSTIRIHDGQVWFGHMAEKVVGGQAFRSLKVCVACSEGAIGCRCSSDGSQATNRGELAIEGPEGREMVSARELCSILVAGLLHEATEIARKQSIAAAGEAIIVNVAAPLDQVAHDPLGGVFQEVLGHATALREKIVNGMPWREARRHYETVAAQPLQSPETRTFGFFPEAIAAIHAYSESPAAEKGLYALIDIGAGTTAVSFFWLADSGLQRRVAFYASHTEIVGADDMDIALTAALRQKYPAADDHAFDSRSLVRSAKEASDDGAIGVGDCWLTAEEAQAALKPVFERIFAVYVNGFRAAYAKEARSSRWEKLTLVLVGGGSLVPGITERLRVPPFSFVKQIGVQKLALPKGIAKSGNESLPVTLLAVGFGLSFVASDIPDYWRPAEVDPMTFRESVRTKDTWGEDQV